MTFSLRLSADLILALSARATDSRRGAPILVLSPDTDFQTVTASSSAANLQEGIESLNSDSLVSRNRSPILWISGPEPLDYPEVARFTNALAASGRSVFLETSGAALKRRIHEFKPSARFHFTVRFDVPDPSLGPSDCHASAFRTGIEALRMARLAGFFTCAHLAVSSGAAAPQLESLHAELTKLDVDGFLITRAADSLDLAKTVNQLRRRLLSWRWSVLSRLVESVTLLACARDSRQTDRQPIAESRQESFEEGAEAG
jgi:hypothetical protein